MLDLKITGGNVFDGRGGNPVRADVGISAGMIVEVGDLSGADARQTVRADGLNVCPGFIDVHSHSDSYLLIEPSAPSKIYQGITTEVVGNCGASAAPRVGFYKMPSDWREKNYPGEWSSVAEYRQLLAQVKPAVNVVLLIGHNSLRAGVVGYDARPASADELKAMKELLAKSLDEGGAGLSTGLIYSPGMFAPQSEVFELAKIAAGKRKIYTSHMRSEGARLLEAIDETIEVGRRTGIRVEVSHLKTSGRKNWKLVDAAIERIRKARDEGLAVAADRYPYTAASTDLDVILPDWASDGGRDVILERLRDPMTRQRIRKDMLAAREPSYWASLTIGSTHHPENASFKGMPIIDVAEQLGMEPVDAALYFMESDELRTGGIFFGMSEENMWKILSEPYVMIGSDASLRSPKGILGRDHPHPRAYGSFPRFLRASLNGLTVPLSEAIRKMTSLAASHFQLKDRGLLEKGKKADVVVFNPATIKDMATYGKPHQFAQGIESLVVNGVLTLAGGKLTGERGGQFLD